MNEMHIYLRDFNYCYTSAVDPKHTYQSKLLGYFSTGSISVTVVALGKEDWLLCTLNGGGGLSIVYTINVQDLTHNFAKKSRTKGLNQSQKTSEVQVCNIHPLLKDIKTDATILT